MLLDFPIFYRNFGVRRVEQLMQPRFGHLETFQLPRRSIVHLAHDNPTKYGPTEQDVALQGFSAAIVKDDRVLQKAVSRPVLMHHVLGMAPGVVGQPVRSTVQPAAMIRQYHHHYRRFKPAPDVERALPDATSLLVYNYGLLPHTVRYPRNAFNNYNEWYNIELTVWTEIAKLAKMTDRPQFVVCRMPQILPARSQLQLYEKMVPTAPQTRLVSIFDTQERLFLAEVWKWFGPNRSNSLLSLVPKDKLSRVNLVFIESGKWTTLNLGMLDAWRKPLDSELGPNEKPAPNLIDPERYQNRILRFFMSITQLRTVAAPEITDLANNQVLDHDDAVDLKKELGTTVTKVGSGPATLDPTTGVAKIATQTMRNRVDEVLDEKPEDTAQTVVVDTKLDQQIDDDLAEMEKLRDVNAVTTVADAGEVDKRASWVDTPQVVNVPIPEMKRLPHDLALMKIANRQLNSGSLSAAQYRHYETLSSKYKTIVSPDAHMTLDQFVTIPPEALKVDASSSIIDLPSVPDKSMLKSSLLDFDKRYIKDIMQRDVASMVMCFSQAGYAITDYEVEQVYSLMGNYQIYTARVMPTDGTASTVRFKLPVIDPDGSYMSNGVKYSLRKQRTELPIVKVSPDSVALTSYYGKAFVRRSEKKVNNYATWLINNLMAKMLDDADEFITNGHPGDMSDNLSKVPRLYSILASGFVSFTLKLAVYPRNLGTLTFNLSFDHTKREELFGKDVMAHLEQDGTIIAGKSTMGSHYLLIDKSSSVIIAGADWKGEGELLTNVGAFEPLAGLDRQKAPVDIAVMKISGAPMPLGVILAYEMGLEPMLALLQTKIRRVPAGTRLNMHSGEESVVFNDESIVFSKSDHLAGLLLGGFNEYHKHIRRYNVHLFNSKEVYLNVLEAAGLGVRYIREMDLFYQMFIDPITHDLLLEMGEPTDMRALLIRAASMLLSDSHPDELDGSVLRLRGYERMAGAVYSEMVRSIRQHNGSAGKSRSPLNMDPFAVFTNIQTDPSKTQVNDINPIQNLKEQEAVTYNGVGGRNSRTMTKATRKYHRNDMGMISSDTVDSSDVAINTYTSADPQFVSLRGMGRPYDKSMGATPLLSTSALLSVASDRDDPKRVNFIGIQHSHGVACAGYHQMPVRTGYEQVIAHRTGDMYAASVPQDGKVVSVAPTGVIVKFADGTLQGYEIGRRFGNAAGLVIPHEIVANVKVGQEFKKGHVVVYNTGFFEPDILNPSNVVWKAGLLVKTVLMEIPETLEDSSALSSRIAEKLSTKVSKFSDIVVTFDQAVNNLVKVGQLLNSEDILCIIEDAVTSQANLFDAESLDTLKILSNLAPQAKVKGVVERIEAYYHGDKEDMSDSLRAIADASDKVFADRFKSTGRKVLTGNVDEAFRVEGEPLQYDHLCIRIYITSEVIMGEGDKGVFANQMKTVVGKKLVGEYRTEKGEMIDAVFGAVSIDNRIVESPYVIGMYNILSDLVGQEAVAAYES
jgi:hypothetical protein